MKRRVVFAVCNSSARHIFVVNREASLLFVTDLTYLRRLCVDLHE
jgi:hypothetical protein